ncbi:DUF4326 domain-containing protein [Streptomyces globisporus]|uniref:DUF4326 domain-containing protein n=1 Tax=Streptomyces globisporus TaxID=1908 RepID=UPI0036DBA782
MTTPVRIQRRRTKGWRAPEGAVYVGRGTRWGNPWAVTLDRTRGWRVHPAAERSPLSEHIVGWYLDRTRAAGVAVRRYRDHLDQHPEIVESARRELAGKSLICWCPTPEASYDPDHCHAAVLLDLANRPAA